VAALWPEELATETGRAGGEGWARKHIIQKNTGPGGSLDTDKFDTGQ
jgi:hypothetical protein